ncbi:MAG: hypothetical protein WA323_18910 [Candidatus Nitrosopolaris sp.]
MFQEVLSGQVYGTNDEVANVEVRQEGQQLGIEATEEKRLSKHLTALNVGPV